ncbi:hypothetical protein DsansV1_C16g0141031 [Dioscorea sansibarensis]
MHEHNILKHMKLDRVIFNVPMLDMIISTKKETWSLQSEAYEVGWRFLQGGKQDD